MKDFTYIHNEFNLNVESCVWLRKMGLKETRWILDIDWFFVYCHNKQITFDEWINGQEI